MIAANIENEIFIIILMNRQIEELFIVNQKAVTNLYFPLPSQNIYHLICLINLKNSVCLNSLVRNGTNNAVMSGLHLGIGQNNAEMSCPYLVDGQNIAVMSDPHLGIGQINAVMSGRYLGIGKINAEMSGLHLGIGKINAEMSGH